MKLTYLEGDSIKLPVGTHTIVVKPKSFVGRAYAVDTSVYKVVSDDGVECTTICVVADRSERVGRRDRFLSHSYIESRLESQERFV